MVTRDLFAEALRDIAAEIVAETTKAIIEQIKPHLLAYLAEQQELDRQMVERIEALIKRVDMNDADIINLDKLTNALLRHATPDPDLRMQ